ncbi:MAG: threonine/serine exporter family protein [Ruminococcaceae bacterium]|nr:threonine/serine exporter family protein [Oscillospiraceae bacterium]
MKEFLSCAMDIGEQMLISGAEVHRVEESIRRMCTAFGAERVDIFIITSSMVATVTAPDGSKYTETKRITGSGTDLEKIHRLNALSRRICSEKMNTEEIRAALDEALRCKSYPFYLEVICYALIAGSFTMFFGGGLKEAFISLFVGAAVRFAILISDRTVGNRIFTKFVSAALATALAYTALKLGLAADMDKIIIGNIMSLIPGIGLTNALRDLFTGDSIAGLLRSVEAVLTALAIAAGYFAVVFAGGLVL